MPYELVEDSPRYEPVATPKAKEEKPLSQTLMDDAARVLGMGPLGMAGQLAYKGYNALNDKFNKFAYDMGGLATDAAAGKVSPEVAGGIGLAANVGVQTLPMIAGSVVGKAMAPAFDSGSKRLMQSTLKPVLPDLKKGDAFRAIDTLLQEGINVTPGGVSKLRQKIYNLNDEVSQLIKKSPATIDKAKVGEELKGLLNDLKMQVDPNKDLSAAQAVWDRFSKHPLLKNLGTDAGIPVQLAQDLKQGTYRSLGNKAYGELKGAETEAQKAIARGLKNGISEAVPNVGALNARESQLLNALNVTERRVLVGLNNNPMGLSLLADSPGKMAAFMADKSPLFKSLVARMMYSGQEQIPGTIGKGIGAMIGAESGQAPE